MNGTGWDREEPHDMALTAASEKSRTKKAKTGRKKTTFKVKERHELLVILEGNDYDDLVDTTIERLQTGTHLKRYPERSAFVSVICNDPIRPSLVQCIMEMVAGYLEMYRENMKGKHYIIFEQHWFESIHKFITKTPSSESVPQSPPPPEDLSSPSSVSENSSYSPEPPIFSPVISGVSSLILSTTSSEDDQPTAQSSSVHTAMLHTS